MKGHPGLSWRQGQHSGAAWTRGSARSEQSAGMLRPGALCVQAGAASSAAADLLFGKGEEVIICFIREDATGTSKLGKWVQGRRHMERGGPWLLPADRKPVGQEMARSVTATPLGQGTKTRWRRRPNRGASHSAGFFHSHARRQPGSAHPPLCQPLHR